MYGDALTTKERIKNRLGITVTSFDTLLDNIILAVTARIEAMTGRRFAEGTYTNELHDGSDTYGGIRTILIVKNAPIQTVSSIQYKAGSNTTPNWTDFDADSYDLDTEAGILEFFSPLPRGKRNIRITYVGGYSGHSIGIDNFWSFNVTPTGTVDGSNRTFTLPEDADQVIVYVDGTRELASNVTFTAGTDSFTLAAGRAPFSSIAVDYLISSGGAVGEANLPSEVVEVCEKAVTKTFKRRESEGKASETFQESSITWEKGVFTDEDRATLRNYRRGYYL